MHKTITAGILAVSLTLTSLAPTQASAQLSDEEAIFGLLSLLIIGAAVQNSRDNDTPAHPPRPQNNVQRWQVLPSQCLVTVTPRRGEPVRMFGRQCLNNNYRHTNRLPDRCEVSVRSAGGLLRRGYAARCVRRLGFSTSR